MSRIGEPSQRYLRLAKTGPKASAAAKARVATKLAASLGRAVPHDLNVKSGNPRALSTSSLSASALGVAGALLVALLLGKLASHESHPAHRAWAKQLSDPPEARNPTVHANAPALQVVAAPTSVRRTATHSRAPDQARDASRITTRSSLREERELLTRARSALGRSDTASASAALADHARRFPLGELREEREALRVHLIAIERGADAGQRALRNFERSFPSSVFTEVLRVALNRHAIASGE